MWVNKYAYHLILPGYTLQAPSPQMTAFHISRQTVSLFKQGWKSTAEFLIEIKFGSQGEVWDFFGSYISLSLHDAKSPSPSTNVAGGWEDEEEIYRRAKWIWVRLIRISRQNTPRVSSKLDIIKINIRAAHWEHGRCIKFHFFGSVK